MNRNLRLALAVIVTVAAVKLFSERVNRFLWNDRAAPDFYWSLLGQVAYYLVPAIIILLLFHPPRKLATELGIARGLLPGLGWALLFTLPMLIGYSLLGKFDHSYPLHKNLLFALKDGFREEEFYRAFLFGQLFRQARWGFIPAVAVNGLIFGLSHLYQAHSLADSAAVFGITFAGAIWFAWLFIEWKENIWVPVFLHTCMNFYWDLFSAEQSAVGGWWLNLPRLLTIALSVLITVYFARRADGLRIQRKRLWRL